MNVIALAFPDVDMLTRSYASSERRTESGNLDNVLGIAKTAGLRDRSWKPVEGPCPMVGSAQWMRGDLGGIACLVQRPMGTLLHLMARDGTPLVIVRKVFAKRIDQEAYD